MDANPKYEWRCPLCPDWEAVIERLSAAALNLAVMKHIIGHEERAAQRAVDKARLSCPQVDCSLGKDRRFDTTQRCLVPKLTDFDVKFLHDLKIKIEE
jgi:hypothetical protein